MLTSTQPIIMTRFSMFTLFFLALFVTIGGVHPVNAQSLTDVLFPLDVGEEELALATAAASGAMMEDPVGTLELRLLGDAGNDPFRLRLTGQFTTDAPDDGFPVTGTCTIIIPDSVQYEVPVAGQLQLQEVGDGSYHARLYFEGRNEQQQAAVRLRYRSTNISGGMAYCLAVGRRKDDFLALTWLKNSSK